jgi:citrate synthase
MPVGCPSQSDQPTDLLPKGGDCMKAKQGLEGIVFSDTRLSEIDGQAGKLSYCGYDIRDLAAKASYEEVYCCINACLPSPSYNC